jgi:hypothetical protein
MLVLVALTVVLLAACGQEPPSTRRATESPPTDATTAPSQSPTPKSTSLPADLTDITRVAVSNRQQTLLVRVTMTNASTLWSCAMRTGDYFEIYIDTDGDREHDREIWLPWNCGSAEVMDYIGDDGRVYCRVPHPSLDTSGNNFTLPVPVRCLGSPSRLRASARVLSDHLRKSLRSTPSDQTDWTPMAAICETTSVADPIGDTTRGNGG